MIFPRYLTNVNEWKIMFDPYIVEVGTKCCFVFKVGVLSSNFPLVSFQEKSETAHETLLNYVKQELAKQSGPSTKDIKNKQNEEHKNLSFQVLIQSARYLLKKSISATLTAPFLHL